MKTKTKVPSENLPQIPVATAEKTLRDIARRNGEIIRKRRSQTLKGHFGDGYAVIDANSNVILSGATSQDGCDLSIVGLAKWYKVEAENTPWQKTVIRSILADKVSD